MMIASAVKISLWVLASQILRLALGHRVGDQDESQWSGCGSSLVVAHHNSTFFLSDWEDVELFTKTSVETGCTKTYRAQCDKGGIFRTKICNGTETSDLICLGGLDCPQAQFRRTHIQPGERVVLRLPTTTSTCNVEVTSGIVKFYATSLKLSPDADELAIVAAKAAQLAGGEGECGSAAMRVRSDAGLAAKALRQLAEAASASADKEENPDKQTLNSLLALHFQERRQSARMHSSHWVIHHLAQDTNTMKMLEDGQVPLPLSMESEAFDTDGLQALAHYYGGLSQHPSQTGKKRALIFTCSFGGGHKSAAAAVSGYLRAAAFESVVKDTTLDEGFSNPNIRRAATLFNDFVIKRQNYNLFNMADQVAQWMGLLKDPCPSPKCNNHRKQQFRNAVLDQRPNLIVTVYHMELLPVLEIAKELGNIPVLHIATDIDIKMKEVFSAQVRPIYPKFIAGIPFDLSKAYNSIEPLTKNQTFLSGYPVRGAFLKPFDEERVSQEKDKFVPKGVKVMLIMTGGGGQDVKWPYILANKGMSMPLHIVIIAGGNNQLAEKLRKAMPGNKTFPGGREVWHGKDNTVTVEVAKDPKNTNMDKPYYVFEDRLALLMDMADVMLSKPGGGSTAEIAYRGVPAIFDTSITLFHWEKFTVDVFVKANRAIAFNSEASFRSALPTAILLGRDQKIAKDEFGNIIDPAKSVVQAAERLLTIGCAGCGAIGL